MHEEFVCEKFDTKCYQSKDLFHPKFDFSSKEGSLLESLRGSDSDDVTHDNTHHLCTYVASCKCFLLFFGCIFFFFFFIFTFGEGGGGGVVKHKTYFISASATGMSAIPRN